MKISDKLKEISDTFRSTTIDDPVREAEILIMEALNIDRSKLYTESIDLSDNISNKIDNMVKRRLKGEPIQYIIGYVNFYGLRIKVGRGVLIPRPETELLVEEAIKLLRNQKSEVRSILDLCTGSGCIAIALAKHFPKADIYGVDKSDAAIEYAISNAEGNNVKNIHFVKGDLFGPFKNKKFDCIISNPPYIKRSDIYTLQREIRDYEPIEALNGGENGLDFYRRILKEAREFLKEDGLIILEIGIDQDIPVMEIAIKNGFKNIRFIEDYSKINRIFIGKIDEH